MIPDQETAAAASATTADRLACSVLLARVAVDSSAGRYPPIAADGGLPAVKFFPRQSHPLAGCHHGREAGLSFRIAKTGDLFGLAVASGCWPGVRAEPFCAAGRWLNQTRWRTPFRRCSGSARGAGRRRSSTVVETGRCSGLVPSSRRIA